MDKKIIKKLKIKWVGDLDWSKFRDLLILKLAECRTEEDLNFLIKVMLGSMFGSVKELNKTRKAANIDLITKLEEKNLNKP